MKSRLLHIRDSVLRSYSLVFFSDSRFFAALLLLASFIDPWTGLSGFICALVAVLAGRGLGLDARLLRGGIYSFNALLVGFAMGAIFQFNLVLLIITALLSLLLSAWLSAIAQRYRLPFLALPFVLVTWIVFLNVKQNSFLIYRDVSPGALCILQQWSAQLEVSSVNSLLLLYFKSLSAIFFQNNIIAGMLIALGLLLFSRIAFMLSLMGFVAGYVYFRIFEAGTLVSDYYYYSAFNYMLAFMAIGGFFLLPSKSAFLLALLLTPVIGLLSSAMATLVLPYHLPLYSLPFSIVTIITVSALNTRHRFDFFKQVQYQLYSPEKNIYAYSTYMERFKNNVLTPMHLPFFGEWTVSQGHDGELTHKEDWRYAWDFVVTDEHHRTFRLPGKKPQDFYCYALPVLAPADGVVEGIEDGIEDNAIGEVNLAENWGNTIIIKHAEHLYSQLSHLKKDSFKVKVGDAVKKGDLLALCGNSGRSPEPHIHFQLQQTPYVGSKTINYPISYYITRHNHGHSLHAFEAPAQGDVILKPGSSALLKQSFNFVPGKKLKFEVTNRQHTYFEHWEVMTDAYNNPYIRCQQSGARAWFTLNDTLFYFTGFSGNKQSLLYYFYLGAYKILLAYFNGLTITDSLPVEGTYRGPRKWLQDALSPFYMYLKPAFKATYKDANDGTYPTTLTISSGLASMPGRDSCLNIDITLAHNNIQQISINTHHTCMVAKHIY